MPYTATLQLMAKVQPSVTFKAKVQPNLTVKVQGLGETISVRFSLGSTTILNRGYSPANLFVNGEVSVWYDPSDLTTLFQDSAGNTPVTAAGQQVGLVLDKSNGATLGPELVLNGTFDSATTGWTGVNSTLSVVSGALRITCTVGTPYAYTTITTEIGKTYLLNVTLVADAMTGNSFVYAGTTAGSGNIANRNLGSTIGKYALVFTATTTTTYISLSGTSSALATQTFDWDNISCKLTTGNPATQTVDTQRPTYGINPIVGTRNLLTYTEQFDNAAWSKTGATVSANTATSPDGTTTADKLIASATTGTHTCGQNLTVPTATTYTGSVYVKAGEYNFASVLLLTTFPAAQFIICDLTAGTIITTSGSPLATSITPVGGGWYRISITQITNAAGTATLQVRPSNSGTTTSFTGDGTSGIYAWGAQLEASATTTAYQKVVSQYEVTEAGVQSVSYLRFDGVDDGMVTGTITPAIDKVQVFAGVRKLSDAAAGILMEFGYPSTSIDGYLNIQAPVSAGTYRFLSRGTVNATVLSASSYPAPITNTLTATADIANDVATIYVNGVQQNQTVTDQGTGNYLAYPLYIGRRGGVSAPYNGRLYSLIVRFGANLTDSQIASTESWVNAKTGAY